MLEYEQLSSTMIGKRLGAYVVQRKLGEGAMGEVYLAVHEEVGQRAAVKVMRDDLSRDPRHSQRFFAEARLVSMLEHPGLVKLFDFRQLPDGRIYLLMEYLAGETLGERLRALQRQDRQLEVAQALRLCRQVASVLREVHGKGVVHRDLKPENLMLVTDPDCLGGERVKLLDFGIAKLRDGERLTQTDAILGSPQFMSPEQCRAEDPGAPSDIYSLGVVLYEMLAGRAPFHRGGLEAIMYAHMTRQPEPLRRVNPKVPKGAEVLVQRMLAKEPKARPDAEEVLQALDRLLQGRSRPKDDEEDDREGGVAPRGLRLGPRWAQAAVLVGVGALALLLGTRLGRQGPPAGAPPPPQSAAVVTTAAAPSPAAAPIAAPPPAAPPSSPSPAAAIPAAPPAAVAKAPAPRPPVRSPPKTVTQAAPGTAPASATRGSAQRSVKPAAPIILLEPDP